ncbi:MAG: HD domain-containing protein [Candidatus Omnitrophica bacterium]|jgi:putative nucleotidyltransferase with HDIG domain|nr:HD domain-containing protein [Candidatus Omnitrophota bacterium]
MRTGGIKYPRDILARSLKPHLELLRRVQSFAASKNKHLYIVGGFLRDIYLGRVKPDPDIDFCLKENSISFGRSLARRLKCACIILDDIHGCCRLVIRQGTVTYTLDFSDFRGPTLEKDLCLRDFTVNTLCLDLPAIFKRGNGSISLIDPYGGLSDINHRRLRILYPKVFDDDPLRMLRVFSMSAVFGLDIGRDILSLISKKKKLIAGVSGERVRDELFKIFQTSGAYGCLLTMDRIGLLGIIFPEIIPMKKIKKAGRNRLDVWEHTIATVREIERIFGRMRKDPDISGFLSRILSSGRTNEAFIKLCCLLHDSGKPRTFKYKDGKVSFYGHERVGSKIVCDTARRLRLSSDEERCLRRITFLHLRPGYMANTPAVSERAVFRFFRDADKDSAAVLLLALADERATKDYAVVEKIRPRYERLILRLLRRLFKKEKESPMRRLLNGHDIMKLGSLEPCELVGKVLREIEESQAVGSIKTRSQALKEAARLIKKFKNT